MNDMPKIGCVGHDCQQCATQNQKIKRLDKELEIVHQTLTALYEIDEAVPIIKKALTRIRRLK